MAKAVEEKSRRRMRAGDRGRNPRRFRVPNEDPFPPIDFGDYKDLAFGKLGALAQSIKRTAPLP